MPEISDQTNGLYTVQYKHSEADGPKLTNWAKEPNILDLKMDLQNAKPSHDVQVAKIKHWNDLLKVEGSVKPPKVKGRSSVQPKLIRRQAEWRYSALTEPFLGTAKLFKVSPQTFEDAEGAKQNELVLNWQFRTKLDKVKLIDNIVRSVVDEGTCILRLGWNRKTVMAKKMVPQFEHYPLEDEESLAQFQQALDQRQENPRGFDEGATPDVIAALQYYDESGEATMAVQNGEIEVPYEKVLENYPTVDVLNPQNFYADPSCGGDLTKALFSIYSFETNHAELTKKGNGKKYKNLDKVNWEGNTTLGTPDHDTTTPGDFNFRDKARKKVVAYEYWGFYDIHGDGNLVPIVATWIGDVIIRMEENPFPDKGLPFVIIPYLPVKRELFGEPDAELLEDNQKILGALMRGVIDLMGRSANSQRGISKGLLDPFNRRRYDNGEDYEYNPVQNPATAMIEHTYPELPQSALTMLGIQNNEAESLTGVKAFAGGVTGESYGDVAAGIRGALDASSKREMAILRRIVAGITGAGNKIIAMNAVFMSEEETIRVTNTEFVKVKREDLPGNYDLLTDISTAEVDDAKSKDLAFMLQTLGPNSDPMLVFWILAEICELKRMPELAQKLRTWKPTPDPAVEEMKQLEIALKKAEIGKVQSEIALNEAKAQVEVAKKDTMNLDYVETETGTKHERDMDKQRAQSQGNQQLQVTKALTTPRKEGEKKPNLDAAIGFNQISGALADAAS